MGQKRFFPKLRIIATIFSENMIIYSIRKLKIISNQICLRRILLRRYLSRTIWKKTSDFCGIECSVVRRNASPKGDPFQSSAWIYVISYFLKNPKSLNEFNKKFDAKKLNAPSVEEFTQENAMNISSTHSHVSSSAQNQASDLPTSARKRSARKRSASPRVAYESFEPLVGQPRLNDKIAFQVEF